MRVRLCVYMRVACAVDQFKCNQTGLCISLDWLCDNENDCEDFSDELQGCGRMASLFYCRFYF